MLKNIFKDIISKNKHYSGSMDGNEFEQKFKFHLKDEGFSEIIQKSKTISAILDLVKLEKENIKKITKKWKNIKKNILLKNSIEIVENPLHNVYNTFIFQPFGSQNFPDFIILTKKYIIPIEIKFSTNTTQNKNLNKFRPMWNSNIPKPNSIYIYGVSGVRVTFFKGSDILEFYTRQLLIDYFKNLNKDKKNLDESLKGLKNNFGIYPYVRKAYDHKTQHSTFVNSKNKRVVESYFSKNSKSREDNVIDFFESLNI